MKKLKYVRMYINFVEIGAIAFELRYSSSATSRVLASRERATRNNLASHAASTALARSSRVLPTRASYSYS